MLAENLLLGLLGAAVGILIAWWGTEALRAMPPYGAFPVRFQTSLDALGPGVRRRSSASAAACSSAPRRRFSSGASIRSRRCGAARSRPAAAPIRDGLMALQCGLALLVLVVAGLFFESFVETRDTDPGFRDRGTAARHLRPERHGHDRRVPAAVCDAACSIGCGACPSVESVALANSMPLDIHGLPLRGFTLEGRAQTTAQQESGAQQHRLARLLQDDGHPDRGRRGLRRHGRPIAAAASDRQRGIRAPLHRAGGSARPAARSTAIRPTRSPAW